MSFFDTDFSQVKVENNFEALPAGSYNVISDNAEIKDTKDGTGNYILIKFKVIEGEQEGRFLFSNFNTVNKNEEAVRIGISQLKQFIDCAGIKQNKFTSAAQLVGYKATAVVKHKTDSYGTKAVISYFKPMEKTQTTTAKKASDGLW